MISILMPLFNGFKFITDSVSSVLIQTYPHWELLVGINGVTIEEYKQMSAVIHRRGGGDKIKIFYYPEQGKVKTLNKLVKESKYNLIGLIDVDDIWLAPKLEKQIRFVDKYDVIGTDCSYYGDLEGEPGLFLGKLKPEIFSWQNPIIASSVVMKKDCACWEEEFEGLDDYNLWVKLLKNNKTFYNLPEKLIYHRIHQESYFNHNNEQKSRELIEKLPKLNEEQIIELGLMYDRKDWKL